jgi:hypothetical protein
MSNKHGIQSQIRLIIYFHRTFSLAQQNQSAECSPIGFYAPLFGDQGNEPSDTSDLSQMFSQMLEDFVSQEGQGIEPYYGPPAQAPPFQYPQLHQLHQQPLLGMPSGSEFVINPHVLALSYDPNFHEDYDLERGLNYFPQVPENI